MDSHLKVVMNISGIPGLWDAFDGLCKFFPENQVTALILLVKLMIQVYHMIIDVPLQDNDDCPEIMQRIRTYLICRQEIISSAVFQKLHIQHMKAIEEEEREAFAELKRPDIADKFKSVTDAATKLEVDVNNIEQRTQFLSLIDLVFSHMIDFAQTYMKAPAAAPAATDKEAKLVAALFEGTLREQPGCTCSTCTIGNGSGDDC